MVMVFIEKSACLMSVYSDGELARGSCLSKELAMQSSREKISPRQQVRDELGSYNDRNDGYLRKYFSKSCIERERINKKKKVKRVKPAWKE